jgi:hypothetical protein
MLLHPGLKLALIAGLVLGAGAAAAKAPPKPDYTSAQLADWLSGSFHPSLVHQTLTGSRVKKLDRPGELMVRMDLKDEDKHARDFWFYGVSRVAKDALIVRQYWVLGDDRQTYADFSPGRDRLVRKEGCALRMKSHEGAYVGRVDVKTCKGDVEGRLFRVNRELSVDYQAVTPTVHPSAETKRKHPDETGTQMFVRSAP